MGYGYMIFYILAFTAFTQLLRFAQLRGASVLYVCAVNYIVATIGAAIWLGAQEHWHMNGALFGLAALNGVIFVVHLLVLMASYNHAGVGITQAVSLSGCVIPIVGAWLMWPAKESMSPANWTGVAMIPVAMFLMRPVTVEKRYLNLKDDVILLLPFFLTGVVGCVHKYVAVEFDIAGRDSYQTVLFCFATASAWVYVLWRKPTGTKQDVKLGTVVGVVNVMALVLFIKAVGSLPAGVFFTVSTSAGIAASLLVARMLWRERLTRRQVAGIAMAAVIVVLANLRPARTTMPILAVPAVAVESVGSYPN